MQKFEKECSKTQLIDIYTAAYKFHQKEADKYKAMLTQLSGNLVLALDQPDVKLTYDVTEEMKRLLVKKNDEL